MVQTLNRYKISRNGLVEIIRRIANREKIDRSQMRINILSFRIQLEKNTNQKNVIKIFFEVSM